MLVAKEQRAKRMAARKKAAVLACRRKLAVSIKKALEAYDAAAPTMGYFNPEMMEEAKEKGDAMLRAAMTTALKEMREIDPVQAEHLERELLLKSKEGGWGLFTAKGVASYASERPYQD
jgi:hypothetical protein